MNPQIFVGDMGILPTVYGNGDGERVGDMGILPIGYRGRRVWNGRDQTGYAMDYSSEFKQTIKRVLQIGVPTILFIGVSYLITSTFDRSVSQQHEQAMEGVCQQSFDAPEVAEECIQWAPEQFLDCVDDPPPHLEETYERGDSQQPQETAALCETRVIEHFSRIQGVNTAQPRQAPGEEGREEMLMPGEERETEDMAMPGEAGE